MVAPRRPVEGRVVRVVPLAFGAEYVHDPPVVARVWHFVIRSSVALAVLFPMWLGYVVPFVRERRFGARIPDAVWQRKHERYSKRFLWLATWMRGGLIKVGQILSTRVDLLPKAWTAGLSPLQDKVTPTPWPRIENRLRKIYGKPLDEVFESIDCESVAAASFGQVHRAVTKDGVPVALKIKYEDVELKLSVDLWVFGIAVRLFNVFLPRVRLAPIYEEMKRALSTELDYEQEARFTRIVHRNFIGREGVVIPEVIDALTTRDVICTRFFEGRKITDPTLLADPALDRDLLLERLVSTWVSMMYVDGVFQSDPHPGNLLVRIEDGDPILCVVDFGQVKILPRAFHQKLVGSVMAFAMGNAGYFTDTLIDLGLFPADQKPKVLPFIEQAMKRIREERDRDRLDFAKARDEVIKLVDGLEGIVVPQELVLYGRTFALLAGVTRAIHPSANPIAIAQPMLTQALLSGGPPERPEDLADRA